MNEIWRKIENTNLYISNTGKVYSTAKKRILKSSIDKNGYLTITYKISSKIKTSFVHQLVAKAFPEICGEWFDGCVIDHRNTVITDNNAFNLKICTQKENNNNPLTKQHQSQSKKGKLNPNHKQVIQYSINGEQIKTFDCVSDVTKEFGFDSSNVAACCRGKYKSAYGYIWKYAI